MYGSVEGAYRCAVPRAFANLNPGLHDIRAQGKFLSAQEDSQVQKSGRRE